MAQHIAIDLRLTPAQRTALVDFVMKFEAAFSSQPWSKILSLWPSLPPEVQQRVRAASPVWNRFITCCERVVR